MIKMSQAELSRRLGLTWQAVQKYEKGEIRIGASRLQEIARISQVTPAFFSRASPDVSGRVQPQTKGKEAPPSDCATEFLTTRDGLALANSGRVRDLRRSGGPVSSEWALRWSTWASRIAMAIALTICAALARISQTNFARSRRSGEDCAV
jgi:transcriptional regulator with XRE-family HTH domain